MTNDMEWSWIGVIASIVGLPLTVIGLYLRSIREQYWVLAEAVDRLTRDYTTKREWERELAQMRLRIERLSETITSLATRIRTEHGMVAHLERDRRRLLVLSQKAANQTERTDRS